VKELRENAGGRAYRLGEVRCEDCGEQAALFAPGWHAYGTDERYTDELPALTFYCPACAAGVRDAR
jgi:hypothetical protein